MELTEIEVGVHAATGLMVCRKFIGIEEANKKTEVIQIRYEEYRRQLDGLPEKESIKEKVYCILNDHQGQHLGGFDKWYKFLIPQAAVGAQLGRDVLEAASVATLKQIPIDCVDGYVIMEP